MIITLWGIIVHFVGQNGDFGFSLLVPLQDCLHCSCFLALKSDNNSNTVSLDKNVLRALFRTHFNPCLQCGLKLFWVEPKTYFTHKHLVWFDYYSSTNEYSCKLQPFFSTEERKDLHEIDVVFMLNVHLHSIVPNGWGPNQLQYFGACSWEHCHWGASPTNSGALWIPRSAGNSGKHHDVPHETKLHCSSHYYDGKLQS